METFSTLLAICVGNSPVPGEFPTQRPVTRSFHVFFDLHLNKPLSKQSCGWWFEMLSRPLWRHCNAFSSFILWCFSRHENWAYWGAACTNNSLFLDYTSATSVSTLIPPFKSISIRESWNNCLTPQPDKNPDVDISWKTFLSHWDIFQ